MQFLVNFMAKAVKDNKNGRLFLETDPKVGRFH